MNRAELEQVKAFELKAGESLRAKLQEWQAEFPEFSTPGVTVYVTGAHSYPPLFVRSDAVCPDQYSGNDLLPGRETILQKLQERVP